MTYCRQNCPQTLAETRPGFISQVTRLVNEWLQDQRLRRSLRRERARLESMPERLLNDIGVDRIAASREAASREIPSLRRNQRSDQDLHARTLLG